MRFRTLIPVAVALMALTVALLLGQVAGQASTLAADLEVTKIVNPEVIGLHDKVLYTVTLSNSTASTLEITSLVDTLPADFEFIGMTAGGVEPLDDSEPEIVWGPITVPVEGKTLNYWVWIPDSVNLRAEPYTNTVVATLDSQNYQAEAGVKVHIGEVTIEKAAAPESVQPGEKVTYTVSFSNSGYVSVPLAVVTDVLPSDVEFMSMTADSDVSTAPMGVTGTITWTGGMTIPANSNFVVEYVVSTPVTSSTLTLENEAWGKLDDGTYVGPASAEIEVKPKRDMKVFLPLVARNWAHPAFTVAKSANPTQAFAEAPGALIQYTVTFENVGTFPGILADIRDTLPAGFTFVRMLPGSDVSSAPSRTTGEIVWTGPFTVKGSSTFKVIYEVRASTQIGIFTNKATATVSLGEAPEGPATATVELKDPILLQDSFDKNINNWTKFLNNHRLNESQWWWEGGSGNPGGAINHSMYAWDKKVAHDGLVMYLAEGAQDWTNYRFEADVWLYPEKERHSQVALWFRGNYKDSETENLWTLGYYFNIIPTSSRVEFWQTQTPDECLDAVCWTPEWQYNYQNPMKVAEEEHPMGTEWKAKWHRIAVEIQGNTMRGYIDGKKLIEYTDNVGTIINSGTVGFGGYKIELAHYDNILVTPLP